MNARERGFLLLTGFLGNPDRRVLTTAQLRELSRRVTAAEVPAEDRQLMPSDLRELGYGADMAARIAGLLSEEALLDHYLTRGRWAGCVPVTRVSRGYPAAVRRRLGPDAPGCLWLRGDPALLEGEMIGVVGSRDLFPVNRDFAAEAGRQIARQHRTLVSGNARGADRTAQEACLRAGGTLVCVVADELERKPLRQNVLYLSEDGFDLPFSAPRAISRNRVIHTLPEAVLVAQCTLDKGGTWSGTTKNLQAGWTPVFCYDDWSEAARQLEGRGAELISADRLSDLSTLPKAPGSLFDGAGVDDEEERP